MAAGILDYLNEHEYEFGLMQRDSGLEKRICDSVPACQNALKSFCDFVLLTSLSISPEVRKNYLIAIIESPDLQNAINALATSRLLNKESFEAVVKNENLQKAILAIQYVEALTRHFDAIKDIPDLQQGILLLASNDLLSKEDLNAIEDNPVLLEALISLQDTATSSYFRSGFHPGLLFSAMKKSTEICNAIINWSTDAEWKTLGNKMNKIGEGGHSLFQAIDKVADLKCLSEDNFNKILDSTHLQEAVLILFKKGLLTPDAFNNIKDNSMLQEVIVIAKKHLSAENFQAISQSPKYQNAIIQLSQTSKWSAENFKTLISETPEGIALRNQLDPWQRVATLFLGHGDDTARALSPTKGR